MPEVAELLDWVLREEARRAAARQGSEFPRYDWYGPDCGCPPEGRKPNGACPAHPRARDKQRPPDWDWQTWYIEAGRGFGKTQTGAEWVRMRVETNPPGRRIALVAPTAADVRDVMVEGESGLLAVSPPWNRPVYQPSKRRVVWPNGSMAFMYSADEPERLRGPQHHDAWCLVGDTPILMADGSEKLIRDVGVGDMVETRVGPRRVKASMMTSRNVEVFVLRTLDGRVIIGTGEHRVWTSRHGFLPIDSLREGMQLCARNASSGAGGHGTATATVTTRRSSGSTGKSGRRRTGRSRRDITSITSTGTRKTIGSITSNSSLTGSTARSTWRRRSGRIARSPWPGPMRRSGGIGKSGSRSTSSASSAVPSSTADRSIRRGSARTPASMSPVLRYFAARGACASIAGSLTGRRSGFRGIVRGNATTPPASSGPRNARSVTSPANGAGAISAAPGPMPVSAAATAPSATTDVVRSVRRSPRRADVYDITVEGAGEFFAGGILVHNCDEPAAWRLSEAYDMLLFGLRLGSNPQNVMTTTPKPKSWLRAIKERGTTALVRGSSYENKDNLAPKFFTDIIRKYEGTRLGRQELEAEDLQDTPGALWTSILLDQLRADREGLPDFDRIVVGVDPSVGDPSGADDGSTAECGIAGGGYANLDHPSLGWVRHGWLLADRSLRGHPLAWGRAVVDLYRELGADVVVCEANNGGALVEANIHAIDPNVPVELVHASRGKVTRAEPIASYYEQRRIYHVRGGFTGREDFARLEAQMCSYTPGCASPDRMDALVWTHTEGMADCGPLVPGHAPLLGEWRGS